MKLSAIGEAALRSREGRRLEAYRDSVGVWTIGDGITRINGKLVVRGMTITNAEADALFRRQIVGYEETVRRAVKVPLEQHQYDALVSICWNIGKAGFAGSTFVKRINARAPIGQIVTAIMMWTKNKELVTRRQAEADQFCTAYAVALPKGRSNDKRRVAGTISGPVIPPIAARPAAAPSWLDRFGAWLGQVLGAPGAPDLAARG